MTSAKAIASLREKLGLTQQKFADRLKISMAAISRYESGQREPNEQVLKRLSALAMSEEVDHFRDFFEAKWRAGVISRVDNLPSSGTQRRIPLQELSTWYGRQKQIMDDLHRALKGKLELAETRKRIEECAHLAYLTLNELAIYKVIPPTPASINKRNREFWSRPENQPENQPEYQPKTQSKTTKG